MKETPLFGKSEVEGRTSVRVGRLTIGSRGGVHETGPDECRPPKKTTTFLQD